MKHHLGDFHLVCFVIRQPQGTEEAAKQGHSKEVVVDIPCCDIHSTNLGCDPD